MELVYCESVAHDGWLKEIACQKSLYRITDCLPGFPKATPVALDLERELAGSVDLVVYAARSLEEYVKALLPKVKLGGEFLERLLARLIEGASGEPADDDIAAVALTNN